MPKLFKNICRVLTGDYFRERSRRKAEELAAERRAEEERQRAQKKAEDRKKAADAARLQEECRRRQAEKLAEDKRLKEEAEEAARIAKEQKAASVEAYLIWQRKIDQRDWKESLRVQMSAPEEIPYSRTDGVNNSFNNRRFWGGWHRTAKGWRKG